MRHEIIPFALQHGTGDVRTGEGQGAGFGTAAVDGIDFAGQTVEHQWALAFERVVAGRMIEEMPSLILLEQIWSLLKNKIADIDKLAAENLLRTHLMQ